MTSPHAHATDLPGWPCPPRARDIAKTPGSWGWVGVGGVPYGGVVQDELGRLWLNGDYVPQFRHVEHSADVNPGAVAFWTETGVGLYVHPKSYPYLASVNSYDMAPDQWMPIVSVVSEPPAEEQRLTTEEST